MSATNGTSGTGPHLGELAQLHALGALEPHERAQVEAHVATCSNCARALGEAELTTAALDDAFVPQVEPPPRLAARIAASATTCVPLEARRVARSRGSWAAPSFYATAAALLLAAGIGGDALVEHSANARRAVDDSAILATIATSHFNHETFTARDAAAPVSKVLYARDGAWLYVIIDSPGCDCRVIGRSAGGERNLGQPAVRGNTATLFVRDEPRLSSIELVRLSGHIVADAKLIYATK